MSRPKGSKNKSKTVEGALQVQTVVNTLVDSGAVSGTIPYLKSEYEGQLIRLKSLGITTEGQTFEQAINAVIFMAGEYKGKISEFEKRIVILVEQKQEVVDAYGAHLEECQNKPNSAPKTEQFRMGPPKQEKGKDEAENGSEKKDKETMPTGLSKTDMLKWHRNHKNQ